MPVKCAWICKVFCQSFHRFSILQHPKQDKNVPAPWFAVLGKPFFMLSFFSEYSVIITNVVTGIFQPRRCAWLSSVFGIVLDAFRSMLLYFYTLLLLSSRFIFINCFIAKLVLQYYFLLHWKHKVNVANSDFILVSYPNYLFFIGQNFGKITLHKWMNVFI